MRKTFILSTAAAVLAFALALTGCPDNNNGGGTTFTVTFNTHNGTPVPAAQNVAQGGFATRPATNPTRTGFNFVDWYTTAGPADGTLFAFATTAITADTVVHARWAEVQVHTVTFDSAGGTAVANQTGIASGGFATEPTPPTRAFALGAGLWAHPMPEPTATLTFAGWFAPGATTPFVFTTPITGNITLTAQWTGPAPVATVPANDVAAAVAHVNANAGAFTLLVGAPVSHAGDAWTLPANGHLTVEGIGGRQTITRTGTGNLFNVNGANRSLTLDDNITLAGNAVNTVALVHVAAGASLTMNAGAQITGNTASSDTQAGGVNVTGTASTFTMNGGEIFGNTATGAATSGGGVRTGAAATFVMQAGAVIRDNTATGINSAGGVSLQAAASTFRMLGGEIRGNTATGNTSAVGGARISAGTFQVVTGVIYGGTGDNANTGYTNDALLLVTDPTVTLGTMVDGVFTPSMYQGNPVTLASTDDTVRVVNGLTE